MRHVIVSDDVFWTLDTLLPARRGGDRPSRNDFERQELMLIRDYFAEHWDDAARKLLPVPGHDAKVLIDRGRLVWSYKVVGRALSDGTIELRAISIDFTGLVDPDTP